MSEHRVSGLSLKIFASGPSAPAPADLVRTFHRWIQDDVLAGKLAIDVADYSHVAGGPGVFLVCHEGLYSFGEHGGDFGLRYEARPRSGDAGGCERTSPGVTGGLAAIVAALADAALRLEREEALRGVLTFATDRFEVRVGDRLEAAAGETAAEGLRQRIEPALASVFGNDSRVDIAATGSPPEAPVLELQVAPPPRLEALGGSRSSTDR